MMSRYRQALKRLAGKPGRWKREESLRRLKQIREETNRRRGLQIRPHIPLVFPDNATASTREAGLDSFNQHKFAAPNFHLILPARRQLQNSIHIGLFLLIEFHTALHNESPRLALAWNQTGLRH